MNETLVPMRLPPGLFRNGTKQDAAGRWYDGNLIRWVEGYPQPIGGWREARYSTGNVVGSSFTISDNAPRAIYTWRVNSGGCWIAVGGNRELRAVFDAPGQLGTVPVANSGTPTLLTIGRVDAVLVGTGLGTFGIDEADSWQLDNFGDVLVAVLSSDGRLFTWTPGASNALVASGAPTSNRGVMVTPERFLVALGAGGDSRKVQWPDQETTTVWTPSVDNQAGDFTLQTHGRIRCGARTKQQSLIWTDVDLYSMNYIGGSLVYSFQQEGDNCGIIGPLAKVVADTQAFWMGRNNFFKYDGFVQPVPCDIHDYIFEDFNTTQASKVWAMTIAEHSEVWWFYVSAAATEIDRYAVYNYRGNHWSAGSLARTCGRDAGATPLPLMVSNTDGRLYEHEIGEARTGGAAYLESGPITLDPDRVMRIQRIVPDGSALSSATMSLYTSMYPVAAETLNGPYSLANPTDVRLSAKHVRVRIDEATATSWRVGVPQLGVLPLGRR